MKKSGFPKQTIDTIASELILLNPSDPRACTQIYDMLEKLRDDPSTTGKLRELSDEASKVARRLIFEEFDSPEIGEEELGRLITLMQTLEDRAEAEESKKPPEEENRQLITEFVGKRKAMLTHFDKEIEALAQGDTKALETLTRFIRTFAEELVVLEIPDSPAILQGMEARIIAESDPSRRMKLIKEAKAYLEELFSRLESDELISETSKKESQVVAEKEQTEETTESAQETCEPPADSISESSEEKKSFDLPSDIDMTLMTDFQTEALEHIQNAEVALLDLETNPDDKESVNVVFRAFHTIKGVASFLGLEYLTNLAHSAETFLDRARKGDLQLTGAYADLAFSALDGLKFLIEDLLEAIKRGYAEACPNYKELRYKLNHPEEAAEKTKEESPEEKPRVGDILVESGAASLKDVEEAANRQAQGEKKPLGEILVRDGKANAKDISKALREQKTKATSAGVKTHEPDATVKVGTARLDNLINQVGELVIAHAMVSQDKVIQSSVDHQLNRKVGHLAKITRSLQELSLSMRMISLKTTFQKMARIVRDLARKSGKEVVLELEGEDTELDRNMVELIADPLVHLIRNAVDHGIESAEEREKKGKPRAGQIILCAMHEAGGVVISLKDDGKGLDTEKLRKKAIEKGLVSPDATLTESEIHRLVFHPGFSTAEKVTDVSGRGVGMDVVRTNIEELRGNVEISSTPNEGSTFTLRLPLTLAIIDGMVVRAGSQRYIIPTIMITESLRPTSDILFSVEQRGEMIQLRGSLIPLYRLHNIFNIPDALQKPTEAILVVVESNTKRCAIMIDEIVDQQQVVIKNLGTLFGNVRGVSGGTVMGDGRVALILDAEGIITSATGDGGGNEAFQWQNRRKK